MSLSKDTLISELTKAFDPMPTTLQDCADKWHVAYYTYARESIVSYGGYTTTFLPTGVGNVDGFKDALKIAFTPNTPYDPVAALLSLANAFSSFWMADISELFIPNGTQLIPVTCIPNPDINAFTTMSFVIGTSQTDAITMIATGVHNYTLGIQVAGTYQNSSPPPSILSFITNIS